MAAAPRSPASLGSTPKRHPPVSKLLRAMRSPDAAKRADALDIFADIVGEAYGEAGAELGMAVRDGDGIAVLASLLGDPYPQVQQQALFVIGNLCSDSVDPQSAHTKSLLLQNGAGRPLIAHAFSDDPQTLRLACGALQNLCGRGRSKGGGPGAGSDREWAKVVVQYGVHQKLEQLLSHEDPMIQRYASGALNNVAEHKLKTTQLSDEALAAVKERVERKGAEERARRWAVDTLTLAVRAMPRSARQRRIERAKQRFASALRLHPDAQQARPPSTQSAASSARSYYSAYTDVSSASGASGR